MTFLRPLAVATTALVSLGWAGSAAATTCADFTLGISEACYDVDATVTSSTTGNFIGTTGFGTLVFDNQDILDLPADEQDNVQHFATLPPFSLDLEFDFTLDIFGQSFSDVDDPISNMITSFFLPTEWSVIISEVTGSNPVAIDQPGILTIATDPFSLDTVFDGQGNPVPGRLSIDVLVDDFETSPPNVIPLPASAWLLGAGVLGAGAFARRRRGQAA